MMETMDTRHRLIDAAIAVIESKGSAGFSTRAVCDIVNVGAPTLYHHFGSADGLLNAAVGEAFEQFLRNKTDPLVSSDPVEALREGWDDYVRFVAGRPRLYAAMLARLLGGAPIAQANRSFELLRQEIRNIAAAKRLAMPEEAAVQEAWASVNGAALLYVAAALEISEELGTPDPLTIQGMRDRTIKNICLEIPGAGGTTPGQP